MLINLSLLRNNFLLIVFWLYLLLNYGFMQIRFPGGVPVGEMVLVLGLITINYRTFLPRFLGYWYAWPLFAWWLLGLLHIFWNIPQYGVWAIRDASSIIESFYLILGFTFAGSTLALTALRKYLPWIFLTILAYAFTFPWRDMLQALSPIIPGSQGQAVNLLFNYTNTAVVLIPAATYFLHQYFMGQNRKSLILSLACLGSAILLFPSRTLILDIIMFLGFWMFHLPNKQRKVFMGLSVSLIVMLALLASLVPINGRLGADFSLWDYGQLIQEMFGAASHDDQITSGSEQRILWWTEIFHQWSASWSSIWFGLGYGMPLTNFVNTLGVPVREPHNDFISVLARGGITSIFLLLLFQVIALIRTNKLLDYLKYNGEYGSMVYGLAMLLFCILIGTIGESPFNMAFYAIPYYFTLGVLLRMYSRRKLL